MTAHNSEKHFAHAVAGDGICADINQNEIDARPFQLVGSLERVDSRTEQAVHLRCHDHIAGLGGIKHLSTSRSQRQRRRT